MASLPPGPAGPAPQDLPQPGTSPDVDAVTSPAFTVAVRAVERARIAPPTTADARADFWDSYFDFSYLGAADGENRLLTDFGAALVREAKDFRRQRARETSSNDPGPEAIRFAFQIKPPFSYGSLSFIVAVSGATQLAKFLFNDPDLVLAFLDICVPRAFASAEQQILARANFTVTPNEEFNAELNAPETAVVAAEATLEAKSNWAEILHEPPRIWWRLQFLRKWSHEQVEQIFC
ncbi:hypothetical protein [Paraburkholderia sp.]|uniref:hypothetical protein n=1 Tax=Paraburkholderia sp. TaxID=1926495 RepID=UPI003C7BA11F